MDGQLQAHRSVVILAGHHPRHIDFILGEFGGHIPQQPYPVDGLNADAHRVKLALLPPGHRHQPFLFVLVAYIDALRLVDADAAGAGDEADDGVALYGVAALGDAGKQVAHAQHGYARGGAVQTRRAFEGGYPGGGGGFGAAPLRQPGRQGRVAQLAGTHRRQQVVHLFVAAQFQGFPFRQLDAHPPHFPFQQVAAPGNVGAAGLAVEPAAYFLPRAVGRHITPRRIEPVGGRAAPLLAGHHFNGVAVLQGGIQRHEPAVDFGAGNPVAQVGMNLVGKVNGRGAGRQLDDVAFGGIDENLVVEQILAHRFQKLARIRGFPLPLQQLAQPGHPFLKATVIAVGVGAFLIAPVGGHPVLGDAVHLVGFNLHLQRMAAVADHRSMERLVHILLGRGDIVVKLPRHRVPEPVGHAQCRVAVGHVVNDDAQRVEVINVP